MKVSELIEELSKYNPDLEVVTPGYEYGCTSVTPDKISTSRIGWNENIELHDYGGEHGDADPFPSPGDVEVLIIRRN